MFGAGARNADGVGFLESIGADQAGGHLAGEADDGDGIHHRVRQTGDGVGRARSGGDQHAADAAGGTGVAFSGMHGGLLVTHEHMADAVLLK